MKARILLLVVLVMFVSLFIFAGSCDSEGEPEYEGRIYNSSDGTCSIAGEALDFYIDGKFVATINSGENISHELTAGEHTFKVLLTSTQEVLEPGYRFEISHECWWFRYGCDDGTYPQAETLISSRLLNPVTFDGQITSSEEWADTDAYDISLERGCKIDAAVMTARFKNDDVWLYILYKIAWPSSDIDSNDGGAIALFTGPCCPWVESDYSYVSFGEGTWDAYGWDESQWHADTDAGGQNDVEGAASHDGTYYWFEFRKRLNSGDGYDWALEPPQTVGHPNAPIEDPYLAVSIWDYSEWVGYRQYVSLQLSE